MDFKFSDNEQEVDFHLTEPVTYSLNNSWNCSFARCIHDIYLVLGRGRGLEAKERLESPQTNSNVLLLQGRRRSYVNQSQYLMGNVISVLKSWFSERSTGRLPWHLLSHGRSYISFRMSSTLTSSLFFIIIPTSLCITKRWNLATALFPTRCFCL